MKLIGTGVAVACLAVLIMLQCVSVTGQETYADRVRTFLLSLFLRPFTTTSSSSAATPSINNSYNTYLTILNSTNTSGIAITPRLRISRELEGPGGIAFLEFLDDSGEPSRAAEVPQNYFKIIMDIMQTFNEPNESQLGEENQKANELINSSVD